MKLLLCVILTLSLSPLARTFSTGAGRASCADMKPEHIRAQPQDPRRAYVTLHTDARSYLPGDTVEVALRSTRDFMGFLLQARTLADDRVSGAFVLTPPGSRLLGCVEESDTVTHADKLLKRNLSFVWKAPDRPAGDVRFLVTVVQSYFVYWARIKSVVVHDGVEGPAADAVTTGATLSPQGEAHGKGMDRAVIVTTQSGSWMTAPPPKPGHTFLLIATRPESETITRKKAGPTSQPTWSPTYPLERLNSGTVSLVTRPARQASGEQKAVVPRNTSRGGEVGPPREGTGQGGGIPGRTPWPSGTELGVLLGLAAGLGMALVAGLRCVHSQHCHKRTAVSLGNQPATGIAHVQECGDLVHVRKIRQDSFTMLQAEYSILAPVGN
ncbi:hypothetical protein GN956_G20637 [Arapaima gigas]